MEQQQIEDSVHVKGKSKMVTNRFPRGQTPCFVHMDESPFFQSNIHRDPSKPSFLVPNGDTASSTSV